MSLYTLGLNHTTAPVSVREQLVFQPEAMEPALQELASLDGVNEAAILSTCNRTELYCDLHDASRDQPVLHWLSDYHRCDRNRLQPYLYRHEDRSAVQHALRVACGLDSLVLGEPQILGQLKAAHRTAAEAGTLGHHLGRLLQYAFAVAKQVRTDTALGASPVSVAFAAASLAKQIFGELSGQTALLIGAGETIELAARHLASNGVARITLANRHVARAQAIASPLHAQAIALGEIAPALAESDIVIASTASTLPVLGKGMVERALKQRKHRPMFMVDLAVPRDIEPEAAKLADVYLYTIDDLQAVIQDGLRRRREAADEASEIVAARVEHFMRWLRAQDASATIRAYRERADAHREAALERALRMLRRGKPPEEALRELARVLTNKLTHDPTRGLDQAGREGRHEVLALARELLQLPDDLDKSG